MSTVGMRGARVIGREERWYARSLGSKLLLGYRCYLNDGREVQTKNDRMDLRRVPKVCKELSTKTPGEAQAPSYKRNPRQRFTRGAHAWPSLGPYWIASTSCQGTLNPTTTSSTRGKSNTGGANDQGQCLHGLLFHTGKHPANDMTSQTSITWKTVERQHTSNASQPVQPSNSL